MVELLGFESSRACSDLLERLFPQSRHDKNTKYLAVMSDVAYRRNRRWNLHGSLRKLYNQRKRLKFLTFQYAIISF